MLKIEKFENILYVKDKKLSRKFFSSRYASCFIITLTGKIRFTFADSEIISSKGQGIFIPQGAAYVNECLETAESIVINFQDSTSALKPCPLRTVNPIFAKDLYMDLLRYASKETDYSQYYLLSKLYATAYTLLPLDVPTTHKDDLVEKVVTFMQDQFSNPALQISDVARHCNISGTYLRRIIQQVYKKTPFELLTEYRMKNAMALILEKHTITETAFSVGYSDVYQFSRAFKRYYGKSPKNYFV